MRLLASLLLGALALVSAAAHASGQTLTLQFQGLIVGGALDGQSVSGTVSYDPGFPGVVSESSTAILAQYYSQAALAAFSSGSLQTTGDLSFSFGSNGTDNNSGYLNIVKSQNSIDQNLFGLKSQSKDLNGGNRFLLFNVHDQLGSASSLFPQAGFALDQPVNFGATGVSMSGTFGYQESSAASLTFAQFTVTSASIVASPVPEPGTAALLVVGVLSLWLPRSRSSHRTAELKFRPGLRA